MTQASEGQRRQALKAKLLELRRDMDWIDCGEYGGSTGLHDVVLNLIDILLED